MLTITGDVAWRNTYVSVPFEKKQQRIMNELVSTWKLTSLNLYGAKLDHLSREIMNGVLEKCAGSIEELLSPAESHLEILVNMPKVRRVFNVIHSMYTINPIEMQELRYVCLVPDVVCSKNHYRNLIGHFIVKCSKLETMVLCFWDEKLARKVDRGLRIFHANKKINIFAGYNSREREEKGPSGWRKLNENWPWTLQQLPQFQNQHRGFYWKVEWNSKLWPYQLAYYHAD